MNLDFKFDQNGYFTMMLDGMDIDVTKNICIDHLMQSVINAPDLSLPQKGIDWEPLDEMCGLNNIEVV